MSPELHGREPLVFQASALSTQPLEVSYCVTEMSGLRDINETSSIPDLRPHDTVDIQSIQVGDITDETLRLDSFPGNKDNALIT